MSHDELFERDGFTLDIKKKFPKTDNMMHFTQWEAKYVSEMEYENDKMRAYIAQLERTISFQADLHRKLSHAEQATKEEQ